MSIAYTQMNTSTIYANNITAQQLHILRNVSIGMLEHCMVESSLLPLALSFSLKLSLLSTIFTLIMNAINFPGNGKVFSSSHCVTLKTRQKNCTFVRRSASCSSHTIYAFNCLLFSAFSCCCCNFCLLLFT